METDDNGRLEIRRISAPFSVSVTPAPSLTICRTLATQKRPCWAIKFPRPELRHVRKFDIDDIV
jgi:hypothetical protein